MCLYCTCDRRVPLGDYAELKAKKLQRIALG